MATTRVTLEQWRYLLSVVEHGGVSAAAETLQKSQSTISYSIKQIQDLLGITIFNNKGRTLELTHDGQLLVGKIKPLVERAFEIEQMAMTLSQKENIRLRISVEAAFPREVLTSALKAFTLENGEILIEIWEEVLNGAVESIVQHKVDVGISVIVPEGYVGTPLCTVDIIPYACISHELHKLGRPIAEIDLTNYAQVIVKDTGSSNNHNMGWFVSKYKWPVKSLDLAMSLVASGLGYGWFPKHKAEEMTYSSNLLPLDMINSPIKRPTLYLCYPNNVCGSPLIESLAKCLITESSKFDMHHGYDLNHR